MPENVDVRSVEALRDLRLALARFGERARPAVDEASSEMRRLREWLEGDRLRHWRVELRRRESRLEDAQQHLRAVRMSGARGDCTSERRAVRRAEDAVDEARDKLGRIREWLTRLETEARAPMAQIRRLSTGLTTTLPAGEKQLARLIESLEKYIADSGGG